jgi:predicted AAA+ superfamily ATPase
MVAYYDIRYPDVLKRVYELYMRQPGMLLDYTNIGRDLQVDSRTIQTYTHYLIENLLVTKLDQYSSNPLTKEKKLKRVYPAAP